MSEQTEREKLIAYLSEFVGDEAVMTDDSLTNIEAAFPILLDLLRRKAAGRLPERRRVTNAFLRGLDDELFDRLLGLAIGHQRRP